MAQQYEPGRLTVPPHPQLFWKAMMPQYTAEAVVKQTKEGTEALNVWVQGEVSDECAYGGIVWF